MPEIKPIFKDPKHQNEFEENGFVKIRLLTDEEAEGLYHFYYAHREEHQVVKDLYHSTYDTGNGNLTRKIDSHIKSVILPAAEKFMHDVEPMMATFLLKNPGEGSETRMHQDPTFVDETRFLSANIWVALHDVGHQNGNLFFIKGTHRVPSLRVTPTCPTAFDDVKDLFDENIVEVPIKRGEAIIINHALLHGATPNLSSSPRVAAAVAVRSKGADWIYHYLEEGAPFDKIEKYKVNTETFYNLGRSNRPQNAEFEGYISWGFPKISREDFQTHMNRNDGVFKRIKSVLRSVISG